MTGAEIPTQLTTPARAVYRRLLGYTAQYKGYLLVGVIGVVFDALAQAAFVRYMEKIIDDVIGDKDAQLGLIMAFVIMGLMLVRVIGNFSGVFGMSWVGRAVIRDLREELFERYLVLPARFFDRHSAGNLIARLTYNSEQVAAAASTAIISALRDVLTTTFMIIVMVTTSIHLTASLLLLVPVLALVVRTISRRFRKISSRIQDSMGSVASVTEEVVVGHRVVKIYGGEHQERERFHQVNEKNRRLQMRMVATRLASSSLVQIAAGAALGLVMFIASRPEVLSDLTPGEFTTFFFAMAAIIPPLKRLTDVHAELQKGVAAADSLFVILDRPLERGRGDKDLVRAEGELQFDDVTFRYSDSDTDVIQKVSFSIPAGQAIGLVGPSGSGKSTLAGLIPRFYDYTGGQILLDGTPLLDYDISALRRQIALVSQDVVLFNDTIANNIAYGALAEADREAIRKAADDANATEFIEQLADGFDTVVGEDGVQLSGGQRQRIAIARALLKDAPILILDEATSALDNQSERLIQEALDRVMAERTTLVIAHRLSTIERLDRLLVLEDGRVLETGNHEDLLQAGGLYASLYRQQFRDT